MFGLGFAPKLRKSPNEMSELTKWNTCSILELTDILRLVRLQLLHAAAGCSGFRAPLGGTRVVLLSGDRESEAR